MQISSLITSVSQIVEICRNDKTIKSLQPFFSKPGAHLKITPEGNSQLGLMYLSKKATSAKARFPLKLITLYERGGLIWVITNRPVPTAIHPLLT